MCFGHQVPSSKSKKGLGLDGGVLVMTLKKGAPQQKIIHVPPWIDLIVLMARTSIGCSLR